MKTKKKLFLGAILIAAAFTAGALAGTFHLIWNETPFSPNQYSWEEPWQIKEMVDFIDAQLTLTGCGYEGQSHDVELVLTNVATTPDYYLTAFDYMAKWYVDEVNQENIIAGTYAGDPLGVGESVTYTDVWVPTVVGVGSTKMTVIDLIWDQPAPITWTIETNVYSISGPSSHASEIKVETSEITGATMSFTELGNVAFTLKNYNSAESINYDYKIEVVELSITVAEGSDGLSASQTKDYNFDFGALPQSGALTMLISIGTY